MIGFAPATTYPSKEPVLPNSVLFGGEIHSGRGAIADAHASTMLTDLKQLDVPLFVAMGDLTEDGTTGQDTTALASFTGIAADATRSLVGNHDLQAGRSGTTLQTAWGFNALNWTYDVGPVRVIGVSPDTGALGNGADPTVTLAQTTLDYLDAQLAAATMDCWIAAHAPLTTALGGSSAWAIQPEASVLAILDAHDNAIAWFSGHTHTSFANAHMAELIDVGGRSVVNVNASAIAYVNPTEAVSNPVRALLATYRADGVDLRIRDHGNRGYGVWGDGSLVKTLVAT